MRIGLYGLPSAGKSYVLSAVKNLEVLSGSSLLCELAPNFKSLSESEKKKARTKLALQLKGKNNFIMDGHFAFGNDIVFTEADGQLYDSFLYLYVKPEIISERMNSSEKNRKYLRFDIEKWQLSEIEALREYCHKNNRDFYVLDNQEDGFMADIGMALQFIDDIVGGYSCVNYARMTSDSILNMISKGEAVSLVDGDKTFIKEDSSSLLGYKTHIFDGNFYTGFQTWRHSREMAAYMKKSACPDGIMENMKLTLNESVRGKTEGLAVILTSGYQDIWKRISENFGVRFFGGNQMCADTKYFIARLLQERGIRVIAFGDSMNDYYMLRQADEAFLVRKKDGSVSSSLRGKNLEGIVLV